MPAYPCEDCGTMVDTNGDGRCKKCNSKKPYKCSKCGKRIGILEVFHPEKLTFRKPMFCEECGPEVETVECSQCGVKLIRSTGIEKVVNGERKVYHKDCYSNQIRSFKRALPIATIAGLILFGYLGYMLFHSWFGAVPLGILGIFPGYKFACKFKPK